MGEGKELQKFLKTRQISVTQLAKETGISSNTLYAIMKRDSNINASTMSKIANALNMTTDELTQELSPDMPQNIEEDDDLFILNPDLDSILYDTQTLINKLNKATIDYKYRLMQLRETRDRIEFLSRQKARIEKDLLELRSESEALEIDLKNRKIELNFLRAKLED